MFLIISENKEEDVKIFNLKDAIIFKDFCDVKHYPNTSYILILKDFAINDNGYNEAFSFFLEELIISLDIKTIITNKVNEALIDISSFHDIFLMSI